MDFVESVFQVGHYRVNDWQRLAAALAAEEDVEGDRIGGWTRFDVDEDDEEGVAGEDRPAEKTARMQGLAEKDYRDWASTPLPILRGKPPLLSVRTDQGRAEVAELLRHYEDGECGFASREEREPVSYQFLWEAVGLDREAGGPRAASGHGSRGDSSIRPSE